MDRRETDAYKAKEKGHIHPCDYPEVPMSPEAAMDRDWKLDHQLAKPIAGPIRSKGVPIDKRRLGSR